MITVYSKPGCPKCRVLKMKLEQKGLEYDECQDMAKMQEMGFKSLPVLDFNGDVMTFENAVKFVNAQ